jgi:hypothetical protein
MAETVYILCAAMSLGCAVLLLRGYFERRTQLLLWSSLGFVGLACNSALLFVDLVVAQQIDLLYLRNAVGLASLVILTYGLIWHVE